MRRAAVLYDYKDQKIITALLATGRIEDDVQGIVAYLKTLAGEELLALLVFHKYNPSLAAATTIAGSLEDHFLKIGGKATLEVYASSLYQQELFLFVSKSIHLYFDELLPSQVWEIVEERRFERSLCALAGEKLKTHFRSAFAKTVLKTLEKYNFDIELSRIALECGVSIRPNEANEILRSTFYRNSELIALAIPHLSEDDVLNTLQRSLYSADLHEAGLRRLASYAQRLPDERVVETIRLSGYSHFYRKLFRSRLEKILGIEGKVTGEVT